MAGTRTFPVASDLVPGTSAEWSLGVPVDRMHLVQYAGASGDFNPIHLDDQVAQAAGYDRVFGHGMLTAAVLSRFVTDWLGTGVRRFAVRFEERLLLGDVLTCGGTVTELASDADGDVVTARLEVRNQRGARLLSGEAVVARPSAPAGAS